MIAKTLHKIAFLLMTIYLPFAAADPCCEDNKEHEGKEFIDCGKQYLHLDQIDLIENAIFVKIDDVIYETPCLYSDEMGYYILQVKKSSCAFWQHPCPWCDHCNARWKKCCANCRRHKESGKKCS